MNIDKARWLLWLVFCMLAVVLIMLSVAGFFTGRKFGSEDVIGTWVPDTFSSSVDDGEMTYQIDWESHFSTTPCEITFSRDRTGELVIGDVTIAIRKWDWADDVEKPVGYEALHIDLGELDADEKELMEKSFGYNGDTYLLMYKSGHMLMRSHSGNESLDVFLDKVTADRQSE